MSNKVFLSYAREDLEKACLLRNDLVERNVNVWFDKNDLKPGKWQPQIRKAIVGSQYFLICLSEAAIRKLGDQPSYQDEELELAFDIAQAQDAHSFTIIPVRLEDCGRGDHRVAMF